MWFIIWLILIGILSAILILLDWNNPNAPTLDFDLFFWLIKAVLVMTLVTGSIAYIHNVVYQPWRQKKLFEQKAMNGFEHLGFRKSVKNICYIGQIDKFYLRIYPVTTETGEWVKVTTFLYPKENLIESVKSLAKIYDTGFNQGLLWASTKIIVAFKKDLDSKSVKKQLREFVETIKKNGFEPVIVTDEFTSMD